MEDNYLLRFYYYAQKKQFSNVRIQDDKVFFEINNLHFVFVYNEQKDKNYISLLLPRIDRLQDNNLEQQLLRMSLMTSRFKSGKCFTADNMVWLGVDQFIYELSSDYLLFDRMVSVLMQMYQEYRTTNNQESYV